MQSLFVGSVVLQGAEGFKSGAGYGAEEPWFYPYPVGLVRGVEDDRSVWSNLSRSLETVEAKFQYFIAGDLLPQRPIRILKARKLYLERHRCQVTVK